VEEKSLYKTLSEEYTASKSYREKNVEKRWEESIRLVAMKYGQFGSDPTWADARFDTVGTECASLTSGAFFSNLTPANAPWFRYQATKKKVNENKEVGAYFEKLTEYMQDVFARSPYYSVGPEWFFIAITIGTSPLDIHEDKEDGTGILCSLPHPRACYVRVDARNRVTSVYERKFWNAEQAEGMFGEDKLDNILKQAFKDGDLTEYEFIDCVRPRKLKNPGSPLAIDWKYGEYRFRLGDDREMILDESGCRAFPKPTLRLNLRGNEPYGWSMSDETMPDVRTCNQMVRTMLIAKHRRATPAKWFPEEGRNWTSNPDAVNYYRDPNRLPHYPDLGVYNQDPKEMDFFQQKVRRGFKSDQFLMLMQLEGQMTAREIMERKREGLSVVSSNVGGAERTLDDVHHRYLQLEYDSGRVQKEIGDPPDELIGPDGSALMNINYMGPLSQQAKQIATESGIVSAIESCIPIFTLQPETKYKVKGSMVVDDIWKAHGAPVDTLRDEKEYAQVLDDMAKRAAQAQAQAMQAVAISKVDPNAKPQQGSPAEAMIGATK
jgi:hypothetical protein